MQVLYGEVGLSGGSTVGHGGISASGKGGLDPDPLGVVGHRAVGEVDVALGGLDESVGEELGDAVRWASEANLAEGSPFVSRRSRSLTRLHFLT